ncbi:hypothetical protein [Isoptericola sp. NPDC056605]|uniref:hypothetical protein n=1 Tax=Isoptericola sp. NPDC056605 TaxID=3345876 RepID=UPI003691F190
MSDAIPTRRGPIPANPVVSFHTDHAHTSEREGDGMAPVYELRHRKDDEETPVEDGPLNPANAAELFYSPSAAGHFTHTHHAGAPVDYHAVGRAVDVPQTPEQKAAGEEFARAIMAGEGERNFDEHLSDRDRALLAAADRAERERLDVAALRAAAPLLDKAGIPSAMVEGLAVAHEQDAELDTLGSLGGSVTAFDKGEASGIELGRLQAIKVIERHKAALKDDPDEYAVSILDDIVLDLMNGATS